MQKIVIILFLFRINFTFLIFCFYLSMYEPLLILFESFKEFKQSTILTDLILVIIKVIADYIHVINAIIF